MPCHHRPVRWGAGRGWCRLRSGLVGGLVWAVGTLAHAHAGGSLPDPLTQAMLLALTIMLAHLVCPPTLTMARAAAAGAAGQVAVHVGLTAFGGHDHGAAHAHAMTHEPVAPFVEQLLAHGSGMLALHLLAAVGVALWLAHGERVALDLIALVLSRAAVLLAAAPLLVPAPASQPVEDRPLLPPTLAHRRRHPHRGPPVALAA